MSTNPPQLIDEPNLSHAWGRALLHVLDNSKPKLAPLTLSVTGFADGLPLEDPDIRAAVDQLLVAKPKKYSSAITGLTIFPQETWVRRGRPAVKEFSDWYLANLFPRLQGRDSHNSRGTYFERMVRFRGSQRSKRSKDEFALTEVNQLSHVAAIWQRDREKGSSSRHSALQVSVFDPVKDHTGSAMLGFPCLQQVSFSYGEKDELSVNAYYPTQYILDRAYGNYLGLCHLGQFMAQEMKLKLVRLNCFIGLPEIGNDWRKSDLVALKALVRARLPAPNAH